MRKTKNILQHELIGLYCTIAKSRNKYQTGLNGKIVNETMKTIWIKTEKGTKRIMKEGCVFKITLDGKNALVEGSFLVSRPEDRIKKKMRRW